MADIDIELRSVSYNGSELSVTWKDVPGSQRFNMQLTRGFGTPEPYELDVPGATSGTRPVTPALDPTVTNMFQLLAYDNNGQIGHSSNVILLARRPAIMSAVFDGTQIVVSWSPVYVESVTGYRIRCATGNETPIGEIIAADRLTTSAVLPLFKEMSPLKQYYVEVCAITATNISSCADRVAVVSVRPVLEEVVYNGDRISARWSMPGSSLVPIVSYTLSCQSPGLESPITHTIPGAAVTAGEIILSAPLDPNLQYRLTIVANSGGAGSSASTAQPLLVTIPEFTDIVLNGLTVTAAWDMLSNAGIPITKLELVCRTTNNAFRYVQEITPSNVTSGTVTLTDPTTPTLDYVVSLIASAGPVVRVHSAELPLVTIAPSLIHASYDGRSVTADWMPIIGSRVPVTGFTLRIYPSVEGPEFSVVIPGRNAITGNLALPFVLNASLDYRLTISTNTATSRALSAPVPLVTQLPVLMTTTYSGREIRAEWVPSGDPRVSNYTLFCTAADGSQTFSIMVADPMSTTGILPLPFGLDMGKEYLFRVCANAGTLLNGCTNTVELLTIVPTVTSASYDNNVVNASWNWVPSESVSIFDLRVFSPQLPGTEYTVHVSDPLARSAAVSTPGLQPEAQWFLEVAARGIDNVRIVTQPLALIVAKTLIQSVDYDGTAIAFTWDLLDVSTVQRYACEVYDGDIIVATSLLSENSMAPGKGSGWIAAPLAGTREYRLGIRGEGGIVTGPLSDVSPVIATTPVISFVRTDGGNVIASVTNIDLPGAPEFHYEAAIYLDDFRASDWIPGVGDPNYGQVTIPYAMSDAQAYSVRGRIVGPDGTYRTGPTSPSRGVINGTPSITTASYDGKNLHVTWTPLVELSLTGYQVFLYETGIPDPMIFETTMTSLSIQQALAPGSSYTVLVGGVGNMAAGPLSEPANPLVDAVGFFLPTKAVSPYPYIFRADIRSPQSHAIALYLPDIFVNPAAPIDTPQFRLEPAGPPTGNFPYRLIVKPGPVDVWSFNSNKIREDLVVQYLNFLTTLQSSPAQLKPGALQLVQQVLAQGLPLNYEETLYYRLGFRPAQGHIDLVAGMRLRIDYEQYQMPVLAGSSPFNGYTGVGTSVYDIGRQTTATGDVITTFNPLLTRLQTTNVNPNGGGGGGIIDLHGGAYNLPYFRLLYPPTFPSSDSTGSINQAQVMVIIGSSSFIQLEQATNHYHEHGNLAGLQDIAPVFFKGRAVLMPEIPCTVNGQLLYVAVGTTVRQLLSWYTPVPFAPGLPVTGMNYHRAIGNVVDDPTAFVAPDSAFAAARMNTVHFDFSALGNYTYPAGLDCFDLPVLPGDSLTINR